MIQNDNLIIYTGPEGTLQITTTLHLAFFLYVSAVKPEPAPVPKVITNGTKANLDEKRLDEETIMRNRERLFNKTKPKKLEKP